MRSIPKPSTGEFAPYASMYNDLLPDDGQVLEHLWTGFETTRELVSSLGEEQLLYRYAPGKWTIKEILVHIVDDERIYAYRALRFARGDSTELRDSNKTTTRQCLPQTPGPWRVCSRNMRRSGDRP